MFPSKAVQLSKTLAPLSRQALAVRLASGTQAGGYGGSGFQKGEPKPGQPGYNPNLRDPDSTYDKAAERGTQYAQDMKEKARDFKDRAGEKYEEWKNEATFDTGKATQKLSDMAQEAKEKLSDTYESVKDSAGYRSGQATQKAKDMAHDAKEKLSDTYESAKDSASYRTGQATQKMSDMAHEAKEKLSDTYESAKEKATEIKDTIKEKVREAGKKLKGED